MTLRYEVSSKTMTATASSGNYMWLLSLVQQPVKATFGVDIPLDDNSVAVGTTAVSMTVGESGLQMVSLGLQPPSGATWSPAGLLARVGVTWPLEGNPVTIYAPSVVYTTLPQSLQVTAQVDIPDLPVSRMTSSFMVQAGGTVSLRVRSGPMARGGQAIPLIACMHRPCRTRGQW